MFLFIDQVISWITYLWWLWLLFIGWKFYSWSKEHVGFSPILTLVIGGLLVWYLVIEHPLIGSIGIIGWILITSGILYLVPTMLPFFKFFTQPPKQPPKIPDSVFRR